MSTHVRGIGLTVPLDDLPLRDHAAALAAATMHGFTDLWSGESSGADAFTPLVLAAAWQPSVALGTAVVSAFTRGPALIAMSGAALADATSAQTYLGIGSSSDVIVRAWNGVPFERPLSRTRDVLRVLRRAYAGDRVVYHGDTLEVDGFRLAKVPERPPRLLVAALRERMLALAGREADGVVLNWLAASDLPRVLPPVLDADAGADVVARLFVVVGEDEAATRHHARRQVAAYLNVPVYADFHRWLGRGRALEPMWSAWRAGDRAAAVAAVPDHVVDDLFLLGTPDQVAGRVAEYVDAGVTTPVLALTALSGRTTDHVALLGSALARRLGRPAHDPHGGASGC